MKTFQDILSPGASRARGDAILTPACQSGAFAGTNPGALRMIHYIPGGLAPGAPLIVVLHGCTQQAEAYAASAGWLELADRLGFAVLAPEQSSANNPNRCFNWYQSQDTTRGEGEVASIAQMIRHIVAAHDLDADRVFITGLSAGGAMTAAMLAVYPELFAGAAVIAGLPYGSAYSVNEALRVMRSADGRSAAALGEVVRRAAPAAGRPIRLSIWHGSADGVVSPRNAKDLVAQWTSAADLPGEPLIERVGSVERHRWGAGGREDPAVELVLVRGMGHGTPLSPGGDSGLGSAAPYMLDVGVSSTLEIAAFWGLENDGRAARPKTPAIVATPSTPLAQPNGLAAQVLGAVSAHVPASVQAVIAKAFKSAGLR